MSKKKSGKDKKKAAARNVNTLVRERRYEHTKSDVTPSIVFVAEYNDPKDNQGHIRDKHDLDKLFFRPICSEPEIERIVNVKDGRDYLLKLRAETIVDHMRLFRVYRNKALIVGEQNWSLEQSFDHSHYDAFLKELTPDLRKRCLAVTCGDIFSNSPNGLIFYTEHGPIMTLSESLRFFLEFMHLEILDFSVEVPFRVRINALRIAVRVMLKTEALDFLMDPRGKIPKELVHLIHAQIPSQMEFIAGHEFAHFLLGHLSDSNITYLPVYCSISSTDKDYNLSPVYNQSQEEEFDADSQSILLPERDFGRKMEILDAALVWFACLDLYEAVCDLMFPKSPWIYCSHPTARSRYERLLDLPFISSLPGLGESRQFPDTARLKDAVLEDVSVNTDFYEMYGSAYLDNPASDWRGPELIDRVDYY